MNGNPNNDVNNTVNNVSNDVNNNLNNTGVGNAVVPNVTSGENINISAANMNVVNNQNDDSLPAVNENLKRVEINYSPPSKFKIFLMIFFLVFLVIFVLFLPEINSFVNMYLKGEKNQVEEKIMTGKLKCSLKSTYSNLDKNYDVIFTFTDNKLEKSSFTITTKGDITEDENTLNEMANNCKQLSSESKSMDGISVSCEYSEGKLVEKQAFSYDVIDMNQIGSFFAEVGGTYPGYEYHQDMDEIEKSMNASNYSCKRER